MNELQKIIIEELKVKPKIDIRNEINTRVSFLKNYLINSNTKGFVLGISGGQDSSLAGKLAQLAIDELNKEEKKEYKFIALKLPHGRQNDKKDVEQALSFIEPNEIVKYDIKPSVLSTQAEYEGRTEEKLTDFHKGNIKARMRMIMQYAIAGQNNLLVIGTDHASEAVTGFFTKYGDGGADILPLSGLTKGQGKLLLKELKSPEILYSKMPTADLLDEKPNQSDEEEMGVSYEEIDSYLTGNNINPDSSSKIEKLYLKTRHKRNLPVTIADNWWK